MICSISYCQSNPPFKGNLPLDNNGIFISIDTLKIINTKLIERKYLLQENIQLDSTIIDLNNIIRYTEENYNIANDNYLKAKELNDNIGKDLNKQKRINYILMGTTIAGVVATVIVCIIK